jgi:hypothetical protein
MENRTWLLRLLCEAIMSNKSKQSVLRRPVECPCCGTKRNELHLGWCPAPPRMNNLPDAAKIGDKCGNYRLDADGWWRLVSPNAEVSRPAPKTDDSK